MIGIDRDTFLKLKTSFTTFICKEMARLCYGLLCLLLETTTANGSGPHLHQERI